MADEPSGIVAQLALMLVVSSLWIGVARGIYMVIRGV